MVIRFPSAQKTWDSPAFEPMFIEFVQDLGIEQLPLQQGLSQTSYVADGAINVSILDSTETPSSLQVKTGIFYAGVIAGSCCADDPTPMNEMPEYCELLFTIDKSTAEVKIKLLAG